MLSLQNKDNLLLYTPYPFRCEMTRDQFHKTAKQELRLKFFLKWKVYSYSVS